MALDNLQVDYLIDPAFQIENLAGKPAVGGHIEVFEAGTDTKVITYQDFDGNVNPFKIPLHSDGRAVILADPSRKYDFYVYDSFNNLMFSRLNVTPNLSGNISIKGCDVYIYNTDGTLDITQQSIQNNIRRYEINTKHKTLGVEAPLYFVEDSDSATIIGFSGDDYATKDYVDSAVSSKLDISSYSAQSGDFLVENKFEYDIDNNITAYNHSAFAGVGGSGTIYEAGDHIDITDNVISVTGLPDSADVENAVNSAVEEIENNFEYNINNYITAYNNSAFAGTNYSAGDYVSIENDTISVTGLQPSGDYATRDDLTAYQPSGDYATHDDLTAYQPTGDYATHDDLTAYQPVGDYYSASNPSGFITNDAITGLQPSGDYATHEDVESAVSGKQDILSAGEGIQIIDNTISVTSQGGGIEQVNHDDTLSGNGNSEPLGIANIEDFVKQDDLTGYATTSLVSSVSSELYSAISGISGDFELVAGSGVELVDDPNAKTTTINVTAEGTPVTAIEQMIESATSGISAAISGSYTLVAGDGIQLTDDDNARTTTVTVTAESTPTSAIEEMIESATSGKLDNTWITATDHGWFGSDVSTAFTGHESGSIQIFASPSDAIPTIRLVGANHTANNGLSASVYGAVGININGRTCWKIDGYVKPSIKLEGINYDENNHGIFIDESGASGVDISGNVRWKTGDYYSASNPSGFLTEIPAGTMNESAFEYDANDKISGYNGSAFAGGSDVPEGVMVESGIEYNAVNEISGYNGSAIAQYGAEKQWLVHDDTLVHATNSAQYALGVNLSAVAQLLGIDETVLWQSTEADGTSVAAGSYITLSEDYSNFDRLRIRYRLWSDQSYKYATEEVPCVNGFFTLSHGYINGPNNITYFNFTYGLSAGDSKLAFTMGRWNQMGTTSTANVSNLNLLGVTGIGRKS